jgi:hypothetical protein
LPIASERRSCRPHGDTAAPRRTRPRRAAALRLTAVQARRGAVDEPSSRSSAKPWCTFENIAPDAIGATTGVGSSQPSCSAISNASVFEPSA